MIFLTACDLAEDVPGINLFSYSYDFSQSDHGWQHGFSDYPARVDDSVFFELKYAYTEKPGGDKALMISGHNYNDDLFMYLKKKVEGLRQNSDYILTMDVQLASDAPEGFSDADGSPGEGVYLKVGATGTEPESIIENSNYIMNIDKGNGMENGENMVYVGNIAKPSSASGYTLISRSNASVMDPPLHVRSNSRGELWLIVGTDSSYKGTTTLYYTNINVVLSSPD
jgi:hypothetical protein